MTVTQLHKELGDLIEAGAGDATVRIEEVGEGYMADLDNVNTWLGGDDPSLTLLGKADERGGTQLYIVETDTRHYTWRAAGSTEAEARERLRQAYLAESEDTEEGAATLAEEANVYQLSPGVALRDDYRIPE